MNRHKKSNLIIASGIVILVLIISIAFCWNERVDFNKKIDHDKVSNYFITLFTTIGTFATIYYTAKQIRITEISNRASIRPDFDPKPIVFEMQEIGPNKDDNIVIAWPSIDSKQQKIAIENIGIGVSKELSYEWVFDKPRVLEIINGVYHLTSDNSNEILQYISSGQSKEIELPLQYLSCCGPKLFTHNLIDQNMDFEEMNPISLWKFYDKIPNREKSRIRPPLTLRLSYTDIQDNSYTQEFRAILRRIGKTLFLTFEKI